MDCLLEGLVAAACRGLMSHHRFANLKRCRRLLPMVVVTYLASTIVH